MGKGKKKKSGQDSDAIVSNKKALRDYQVTERFEAGIELKGTEVKSIREGKMNLQDAFARIEDGEIVLHGCDIQPYERASHEQHLPRRPRRLLMHKKEIERLYSKSETRGLTLVALRAYWKNRRVKIEIGLAKGKTHQDQREDIKKKVMDREAQRAVADFNRQR